MIDCRITAEPIDPSPLIGGVEDELAGALSLFVGLVRRTSSAKVGSTVMRLEYEAYLPMAERELYTIAREATERYGVLHLAVHHRIGILDIGDVAVVVTVSTPHRAASFDACRYVIEELKQRVPIWKKEVFVDGSEWVNARP